MRDQIRDRLAFAFEDLGEHKLKNITRPVHVFRIVLDERPPALARATHNIAAAPLDKPAVAVLPFQNLGGKAEAEFFLDSVAEDLITELARARWFSIIARNTSFTYKGKGADSKQLARDLGVRYVVEGSLRKAGNRVRVSCQLVEAASGQHLWAERFEGTLEDSFDLQNRITESVIGSVAPVLREAEIERARREAEIEQVRSEAATREAEIEQIRREAESEPRVVNACIEDGNLPLIEGKAYRFGISIGARLAKALAVSEFREPDWQDRESVEILIVLSGSGFKVTPGVTKIALPSSGTTAPASFQIMPVKSGSVLLRISLFLIPELMLLQEFELPIDVLSARKAA